MTVEWNDDGDLGIDTETGYTIKIYQDDDPESPREWDNLGTMVCSPGRYDLGDKNVYSFDNCTHPEDCGIEGAGSWDIIDEHLEKYHDALLALPLTLYDHSGISISATRRYPFGDLWDTSSVGYIFVTKEKVRKEWSVKRISPQLKELVRKNLLSEVEVYNQYLTGDVWGYSIFAPDNTDENYSIDSCCGFYGHSYCQQEAESALAYYLAQHTGVTADF